MIRNVYNASQTSNTNYFTLFTNHIPLGLKALQGKMKILSKLRKYYPEELNEYLQM